MKMNNKAFIRTNLIVLKYIGAIALHLIISQVILYFQSHGNYIPDLADRFGFVFIIAPLIYGFIFVIVMCVRHCILLPIYRTYKTQCKRDDA